MTRLPAVLIAAASLLGSAALVPAPARACVPPEPAILFRAMFPPPGAIGVPTNVKVVVSYRAGANYGVPVDAGDPGIGTDLELRRKGGAGVAIDRQNVAVEPTLFHQVIGVVLTPTASLAPGVEYEVVDRRPNIPCGQYRPVSCALGDVTVVGSFATAAGPDEQPPSAPTGPSLMGGSFDSCTTNGCCGSWVAKPYGVRWDQSAPGTLLYNVYLNGSTLMRLYNGNGFPVAVNCAGYGNANAVWVGPGSLRVHAVDWAGNEGPGLELGTIPANACAAAPLDAGVDVGPEAGPDLPPDQPPADAGVDAAPSVDVAPSVDAAPIADAASSGDAAPARRDGPTAIPPSPATRSSGGCQLGGSAPPAGPAALLLLLIAAVDRRRRRR